MTALDSKLRDFAPSSSSRPVPVAIIGIGCRLPGGVNDPRSLVSFLEAHGDGVRDVPADRYALDLHYDPDDGEDKVYVKRAGFIDQDIFSFDPQPFGISPREADHLDPQQRLLLETTWEAFEDAGLPIEQLRGSNTAVYVGGFMLDALGLALTPENRDLITQHTATGAPMTVLANRLSHTFDLRGPSMTIDTACSSSLVATHLACETLASGASDLAIAGGVNVILTTNGTLIMCKGKFLAPDGRSKAFEAGADGYGRGEGAGVVLLKRLDDALRDGDRVYAVLRSTGVNQDGRTDGMPLPSADAQASLSAQVLARSGILPGDVAYAEAHGTGTRAGDPIEVRALAQTYGRDRTSKLGIGSIKTNIGHLEAGAGVAGLLKVALSISVGRIFPQQVLREPNPDIPFDELGVEVVEQGRAWPNPERRIAAVNSFGYGGTNAHVLVSDLASAVADLGLSRDPAATPDDDGEPEAAAPYLLISAASEASARANAGRVAELLAADDGPGLDAVRAALALRRSALDHRFVAWPSDRQEAIETLRRYADGALVEASRVGRAGHGRKTLWVFTGMGPQWWGMAADLYAADPVFRAELDRAEGYFREVAGWSLLDQLLCSEAESNMARNAIAQPANLFVQAGLIASLQARGLAADGYLGHSVGEVTAAYASGALTLREAVVVAYHRSQLQQQAAGQGTMLATAVSAARARALIGDRPVDIAAYNAPNSVALAGEASELRAIAEVLEREQVFARLMTVEVAYHSRQMDPLREGFMTRLAGATPRAPQAPLYSTLLGRRVDEAVHDAAYWWGNARQPVLLQRALEAAYADGYDLLLEIGPHPVLRAAIQENAQARAVDVVATHTLHRRVAGDLSLHQAVATLFVNGGAVDWSRGFAPAATPAAPPKPVEPVDLPRYGFAREHHWIESTASRELRLGRLGAHPMLQRRHADAGEHVWSFDVGSWAHRWVRGHQVDERVVFPGAGYVEAMVAAAREAFGEAVIADTVIEALELAEPLVIEAGQGVVARIEVEGSSTSPRVTVSTFRDGQRVVHARARLHPRPRFAPVPTVEAESCADPSTLTKLSTAQIYARFAECGLRYDDDFRSVEALAQHGDEVVATLRVPVQDGFAVHPAVLDGAFQALLAPKLADAGGGPVVPVAIGRVRVLGRCEGPQVHMRGRTRLLDDGSIEASLELHDDAGQVILELRELRCRPVRPQSQVPTAAERAWFHEERWEPAELVATHPRGRWAVVGARGDLADTLAARLKAERFTDASAVEGAFDHVVAVPGTDEHGLVGLLEVIQTLAGEGRCAAARLSLVTQGAYASSPHAVIEPMQGALVGLARVAMTEHPRLGMRIVDVALNGEASLAQIIAALAVEAESDPGEESSVSAEGLRVRRIVRNGAVHAEHEAREGCYRPGQADPEVELFVETPGRLDSLVYRPINTEPLAADEVEIAVETTSVNFKDVMKAMGMLSATALESTYLGDGLGMEAVGRVTAVGAGIDHVEVGQRVYVWRGGCIATRVRTRAPYVVPLAEDVDAVEAACRFVMITAQYALVHVGRLAAGERVLIHSAAGGVGMAAVQIAQRIGAEIFATAGTPEKRQRLRALGIEHVYDSRTLDFADAIRRDTNSEGVDVVLNALAGPAQRKSLELLRDGGRFLEIGKQDIAGGGELPLLAFNRALTFAAIDLDRLSSSRETLVAEVAREVWAGLESGELSPLPVELFWADRPAEAFRRLASGDVIGKVALDFRGRRLTTRPGLADVKIVRPDATYLITGGLGGFGLRTAQWLAERGATRLVLASRRGQPQAADVDRIRALEARGVAVEKVALDVCDPVRVREVIDAANSAEAPLRGVFHSAMVLDDGPLATLDAETLARVLAPKVSGALNLDAATRGLELDHFVMYSSVSALVGNPGQGAYAAANAFLDALALHRRRDLGLPGLSVAWGALGESGVVARDEGVRRHLESMGLRLLAPARALVALERALAGSFTAVGVIDIDWSRWRRATAPTPWRRLDGLDDDVVGEAGGLWQELAGLAPEVRTERILDQVRAAVGEVLRVEPDKVDTERPLKDYGVDSLMAVELQVALEQRLEVEFSTMELLAGRSVKSLASRAQTRLEAKAAEQGAAPVTRTDAPATIVAETPAQLRARFLTEICVQEPYFALDEMAFDGDWIHASARPTSPAEHENSRVSVAEAARHLAILGSCAVRARESAPGRIYYPVQGADLLLADLEGGDPLTTISMRARCLELDRRTNVARALTEILDEDGQAIVCFEISYHVIPEAEFELLFADRRQPTDEASGQDPYGDQGAIAPSHDTGDGWRVELGEVTPEACLGHFVGYPAYPVSIMARDALALVAQLVRRRGRGDERVRVVGGHAGTTRFIFAGERAHLLARPVPFAETGTQLVALAVHAPVEVWQVEIASDEGEAAWFDMHVMVD